MASTISSWDATELMILAALAPDPSYCSPLGSALENKVSNNSLDLGSPVSGLIAPPQKALSSAS